jgi:hypothetical protein
MNNSLLSHNLLYTLLNNNSTTTSHRQFSFTRNNSLKNSLNLKATTPPTTNNNKKTTHHQVSTHFGPNLTMTNDFFHRGSTLLQPPTNIPTSNHFLFYLWK